ncbi:MAG: thiamine-phosphate kinase [Cyanobacteriota bacterium]|nr:thiamine-phosphate kinase [Cyanobacteriota bacterium]
MTHFPQLRDLGEQALLKRVQDFCPPLAIGDDGAVIDPGAGQELVVTTDLLVEGVHFNDLTAAPADVGWRAAAANLSDLAAMGAAPLGITVGLALPGDRSLFWVEEVYRGLRACLDPWQAPILGGDLSRSPVAMLAITALGTVSPGQALRRSSAQPGDAIVVTGAHGASKAGLELLLHPERQTQAPPDLSQNWILAHRRPRPRLDVAALLREFGWERTAGMDSSDGLADAVLQLCRASGVGARITSLPLPAGLQDWVGPERARQWALYGGEDFELALCLPRGEAEILTATLGDGAAIIGETTTEPTVYLELAPGLKESLSFESGFQHFHPKT